MTQKTYQLFATLVDARLRSLAKGNHEWINNHTERLRGMMVECLPSGAGFDGGSQLDLDKSTPDKLVFNTQFHHMNDNGMYVGWTAHSVIVTPSLVHGINIRVTGRNYCGIKERIEETFHDCLVREQV